MVDCSHLRSAAPRRMTVRFTSTTCPLTYLADADRRTGRNHVERQSENRVNEDQQNANEPCRTSDAGEQRIHVPQLPAESGFHRASSRRDAAPATHSGWLTKSRPRQRTLPINSRADTAHSRTGARQPRHRQRRLRPRRLPPFYAWFALRLPPRWQASLADRPSPALLGHRPISCCSRRVRSIDSLRQRIRSLRSLSV